MPALNLSTPLSAQQAHDIYVHECRARGRTPFVDGLQRNGQPSESERHRLLPAPHGDSTRPWIVRAKRKGAE